MHRQKNLAKMANLAFDVTSAVLSREIEKHLELCKSFSSCSFTLKTKLETLSLIAFC
jgi:hypothetical protein